MDQNNAMCAVASKQNKSFTFNSLPFHIKKEYLMGFFIQRILAKPLWYFCELAKRGAPKVN